MDDTIANTLEHAVADLGGLLVQMDKFRARHAPDATTLRMRCLGVGDRARRAHRHGILDATLATTLLRDATTARADLAAWFAALRQGPAFQAARRAFTRPGSSELATALEALFDGARAAASPGVLYHPVPWQRRGRPRPIAELVEDLVRLRRDGIEGEGDQLAPGVDPELPGVRLHRSASPGEPLSLLYRNGARPAWVLEFESSDDVIVPGATYRGAFVVHLARPDGVDLDEWLDDPASFIGSVATAAAAAGLPLEHAAR